MLQKAYVDSPFGCFELSGSSLGLQRVRLSDKKVCPAGEPPLELAEAASQLRQYFARERTSFELTFDWAGAPDFHQAVWKELMRIPYGRTTSYSAIAEKLGDANKMRAVGQANRNNPLAIIVPCHRVIAKNGNLHGYFYGLDVKRKLLELENPMSFATQGTLF
ncbi:MAG: methylated-DNA--[protein]-cysteine S-methyltransferase [Bacteroidota bacterium]